ITHLLALHPSCFPLYDSPHPRDLHSFPTRRSSDLRPIGCCVRRSRRGGSQASFCPETGASIPSSTIDLAHRASTTICGRCSQRRSEEHTSELQSHLNLVCRLLLEKKKHRQKVRYPV